MRPLLLSVAVFLLSLAALSGAGDRRAATDFATDEAEWLTISVAHYQQALGRGNPHHLLEDPGAGAGSSAAWKEGIHRSTFGFMNPGLPKMLLGGLLDLGGQRAWDPHVYRRFTRVKERKQAARAVVAPGLRTGRSLSRVLAAGIALASFWIAHRLAGGLAGLAAAGFWLASPIARESASRVGTDLHPLFFATLALAVALHHAPDLLGERGRGRALAATLCLAALAGLAVASKLNGALVVIASLLTIPLLRLAAGEGRALRGRTTLIQTSGMALVASGVFWLFNPALWSADAMGELGRILDLWAADTHQRQADARGGLTVSSGALASLGITLRGLWAGDPMRGLIGVPIVTPLAAVGAALLGRRLRRGGRLEAVALGHLFVIAGGTALWVPLDWNRYYLPLIAASALLAGIALGGLAGGSAPGREELAQLGEQGVENP